MAIENSRELLSASFAKWMLDYAGGEPKATPAQRSIIDEVSKKFQFGEILPVGESAIILPQEIDFDSNEISSLEKMLQQTPEFFGILFGESRNSKPKVIGVLPGTYRAPIDGRQLLSMGAFFSKESRESSYDLIYVTTNGTTENGNHQSTALLLHELYHPEIKSHTKNEISPFIEEGLGELLTMMYMTVGQYFLEDPNSSTSTVIQSAPELLLRKKGAIAYPLAVPTLFSIMPSGDYLGWLQNYFQKNNPISDETAMDWLKTPVRGRVPDTLHAIFQYRVNLSAIAGILGRGISLSEFSQKLLQAHQVDDTGTDRTERARRFFQQDLGISLPNLMSEARELGYKSLATNYEFQGINILERYIESVSPLLEGCTSEEAEQAMANSQITWK